MNQNAYSPSRQENTTRKLIAESGQYTVTEVIELEGVKPNYDVYDLVIRGHTALTVGETIGENGIPKPEDEIESLQIAFDPAAVEDIGVQLMRASHIVIPLAAINVLEAVTNNTYADTRWIQNPLNHSSPFKQEPVTYPSPPAPNRSSNGTDSDDGAVPAPGL